LIRQEGVSLSAGLGHLADRLTSAVVHGPCL